ncbi:Copia protein [Gossypium australe]|uniref:Copia protein n=1 Tax=Gossypium australe TaxID=47621 RepID=A0A5B6VF07_9ROSI|nr:Copia protein [Gossypium australe]
MLGVHFFDTFAHIARLETIRLLLAIVAQKGVFSWCSRKYEIVAQFTVEVECITATVAANQALWLRKVLLGLNFKEKECTEVFVDNQAAIAISNNLAFQGKTKHFNIKLFFLRYVQKEGSIELKYCKTDLQLDIFTKALPRSIFESLREILGICSN